MPPVIDVTEQSLTWSVCMHLGMPAGKPTLMQMISLTCLCELAPEVHESYNVHVAYMTFLMFRPG